MNRRNFLQACFGGAVAVVALGAVPAAGAKEPSLYPLLSPSMPNHYGYRISNSAGFGRIHLLKNGEVYNFPDHPLWDTQRFPPDGVWKLGWDRPETDV